MNLQTVASLNKVSALRNFYCFPIVGTFGYDVNTCIESHTTHLLRENTAVEITV